MKTNWASIAKIEADSVHSGTGFLVSPKHVLTALHVVADKSTGQPFPEIRLRFDTNAEYEDGSAVFETGAHIVNGMVSLEHDFALLECDQEPPGKPLRIGDRCQPHDHCSSPGFAVQDPSGFTAIGQIASLNDPVRDTGVVAIGIQFQFGSGVLMKGHSGAPLFVNERVVGLLRTAFLDETEKTMGGIVHATPMRQVIDFCGRIRPGLLEPYSPVRWPTPLLSPSRILADRKEEFEAFERMVTGRRRQRVLLLEGKSGSGKTALRDELIGYAHKLGIHVAEADCKGCPSMDEIFSSLLASLPSGLLRSAETAAGFSRFHKLIEDLTTLDKPLVLFLDSWQDSSYDVRKWFLLSFLPSLRSMPGAVVVIAGQRDLPDPTSSAWEDLAERRRLDPIHSTEDWLEYTRRKWPHVNIAEKHIEAFVIVTDGWPKVISENLEALQSGLQSRATMGTGR